MSTKKLDVYQHILPRYMIQYFSSCYYFAPIFIINLIARVTAITITEKCSSVLEPISGSPLSLTPTINYGREASYLFSHAYFSGW